MSRTKRHIPHWATPKRAEELKEYAKVVVNAPISWKNMERNAFFIGSDKLGRKTPILDPDEREEVWGEGNKRSVRTRLARQARRQGKEEIATQIEEDERYYEDLFNELRHYE